MEIENEIILNLYSNYDSVLGPYERKDGRKHIVLNNSIAPKGSKGKTKTISYPRALYETILNRRLKTDEEIDHKDGNKTNDHLNNFQLISGTENRKKQFKEGNNSLWGRNKIIKV